MVELIWGYITTAIGWLRDTRLLVPAVLAVLGVLLLAFGKSLGFTTEQTYEGALLMMMLFGFGLFLASLQIPQWVQTSFAVILGVILLYGAARKVHEMTRTGPPPPTNYGSGSIDVEVGTPEVMLTPANLSVAAKPGDQQAAEMDYFWEWMREGMLSQPTDKDGNPNPDKSLAPVVVKGKTPFNELHNDIEGHIVLNNNLKIAESVALLKSAKNRRMNLRRMGCTPQAKNDEDDENGAEFTLDNPQAGEVVWFLLKVVTKKGQPIDGDTDNYGINVKVNQNQ